MGNAACKAAMKNGGPISEHTCVHDAGCHARLLATSDVGLNISESSLPEAVENVSLQLDHRRRKWFHKVEHEVKHDEHKVDHGVEKVGKDAEKVWNKAKCPMFKKACEGLFKRVMTTQSECVEAAGAGPEDPAADACAAAMSGTVEAACAVAVKDGRDFGVHECMHVLDC